MRTKIRKSSLKRRRKTGFRAKRRTKGGRRALKRKRTGRKQKPARKPQPRPRRKRA